MIFVKGTVTFINKAIISIGKAVIFVNKGSSVIGRLFKIIKVKLYCCWASYRGLYKLGYHRSLALVKGEGEASGVCIGGAYVDKAYTGKACIDRACVGKACTDKAAC